MQHLGSFESPNASMDTLRPSHAAPPPSLPKRTSHADPAAAVFPSRAAVLAAGDPACPATDSSWKYFDTSPHCDGENEELPYDTLSDLSAELSRHDEHLVVEQATALRLLDQSIQANNLPATASVSLSAITAGTAPTPLLVVSIELPSGRSAPVTITDGDESCADLALDFVLRHELDRATVCRPLTAYLQQQADGARAARRTKIADAPAVERVAMRPLRNVSRNAPSAEKPVPQQTRIVTPEAGIPEKRNMQHPSRRALSTGAAARRTASVPKGSSGTATPRGNVGDRLYALAATRDAKVERLKREQADERDAAERALVFRPTINRAAAGAPAERRTMGQLSSRPARGAAESSEELELRRCTFAPVLKTATGEAHAIAAARRAVATPVVPKKKATVAKSGLAERLAKAQTAARERLDEKRRFAESIDPSTGKPLFRPNTAR
jgi:hypothetical protein